MRGPNARGPNARGPNARGPNARGPNARGPNARGPNARGPNARAAPVAAVAASLLGAAALSGCGLARGPHASPAGQSPVASVRAVAQPSPTTASTSTAPAAPKPCPAATPAGFSCTMRTRIAEVEDFLKTRPGMIGIVLRDRGSGAVWRNKYAGSQVYMASTSKLAIATTLLLQNQAGVIHLSSSDRALMQEMLHVSDDNAADDLWFEYGASFYTSYFPRIGLTTAQYLPQQGVTGAYWGEMTCTPDDLDRLINYVLGSMPASLSDYLTYELRHVATVQHFGVWGAGPASDPGNKDGWSVEKPGWIIDSVGFAGPGARYTLTMMNSLEDEGDYQDGTDTVTQVAAVLFRGHQIPAPTLQATP
jgi:hypothetical protein